MHRQVCELETAALRRRPRIWAKQNASQFARLAGPVRGNGFICERIEFAGASVTFDRGVKLSGLERLIPRAKPGQFAWGEPFNSLLDFFRGGHVWKYIIRSSAVEGYLRALDYGGALLPHRRRRADHGIAIGAGCAVRRFWRVAARSGGRGAFGILQIGGQRPGGGFQELVA